MNNAESLVANQWGMKIWKNIPYNVSGDDDYNILATTCL